MLAHQLDEALATAPAGVSICYYRGHLAHDMLHEAMAGLPKGRVYRTAAEGKRGKPIADLQRAAWKIYETGCGFLLQRRFQNFAPGGVDRKEAPPIWEYLIVVASEQYREGKP